MTRVFIIILSLIALAASAASDQIPPDRIITKISVYENDAVIYFAPSFANSQGCTENASNQLIIDMANEQGKTLLASAMNAATANLKVGFGVNGCKNSPKIYRIDINYGN